MEHDNSLSQMTARNILLNDIIYSFLLNDTIYAIILNDTIYNTINNRFKYVRIEGTIENSSPYGFFTSIVPTSANFNFTILLRILSLQE